MSGTGAGAGRLDPAVPVIMITGCVTEEYWPKSHQWAPRAACQNRSPAAARDYKEGRSKTAASDAGEGNHIHLYGCMAECAHETVGTVPQRPF